MRGYLKTMPKRPIGDTKDLLLGENLQTAIVPGVVVGFQQRGAA